MRRFLCIGFIGLALIREATPGQPAPTESQTLQSLLGEVRLLRQTLQTTTVAAQRVQVTLFRLQIQVLAVARATQRSDEARSKAADAEFTRKHAAALVDTLVDLQSRTEDQRERNGREEELRKAKGELEMRTSQEQQLRTIESEALSQVQAEQTKLSELQDGLDRLDKALENLSQR